MFVKYSSLLANFAYLKKKKKKRGNNTRATIPPFVPCLLTCYEGQSGTSFTATNPNHASACIGRPPKVRGGGRSPRLKYISKEMGNNHMIDIQNTASPEKWDISRKNESIKRKAGNPPPLGWGGALPTCPPIIFHNMYLLRSRLLQNAN